MSFKPAGGHRANLSAFSSSYEALLEFGLRVGRVDVVFFLGDRHVFREAGSSGGTATESGASDRSAAKECCAGRVGVFSLSESIRVLVSPRAFSSTTGLWDRLCSCGWSIRIPAQILLCGICARTRGQDGRTAAVAPRTGRVWQDILPAIFWLLCFYKKEPVSRSALIKLLFGECARVAIDATFGFPLGMAESLDGRQACYFDSQD